MIASMSSKSVIDTRRDQMFPVLEMAEIGRLRRFGNVRWYGAGEPLVKVGEVGHGLIIVLSGHVDITQHDRHLWRGRLHG
jgi:thioredoxin reductase (NADPH)